MTDSKRPASNGLRRTLGLARPDLGWLHWLRDPHFVLAALAAVPVWLALGQLAGGRMQLDVAATALVSFALLQPAVEELVFRGALQGHLLERSWTRRIGPISSANLVTTAAFVALHFVAQPPAWAVAVAVPPSYSATCANASAAFACHRAARDLQRRIRRHRVVGPPRMTPGSRPDQRA